MAEAILGSKENIGAQLPSRPAVPIPVVDLSAEKFRSGTNKHEVQPTQRPKPLGFNNSSPIVSTPSSKVKRFIPDPAPAAVKEPIVLKATPMAALPNWSLLSDSPTSSVGSPAPTSRPDIDDMAEAMSALKLRQH